MARTLTRLTPDHLAQLDDHVRTCLFWLLDPVALSRVEDDRRAQEVQDRVADVLREWGDCGQVLLVDGTPVGLALYGPARFFHGAAGIPTSPVSSDAVLLAAVHVAEGHREGGLGRMLVQGAAADLVRREVRALEAFGDTRADGQRGCVLPTSFLEAVGFRPQREHPVSPRMRMDLRTTSVWDGVEAALQRLLGLARPAPKQATRLGREPGRVG